MLSPLSLVSLFRWSLFILMIAVSIFINRWLGFGLLVALLIWEITARFFAPFYYSKKLKKGRLRSHLIRESMKDSLWKNHKGETELLELSADWPLTMIIDQKKPKLFFNPILKEKLTAPEITMVLDWMYFIFQRRVSFASLQLILLMAPATVIFRTLDRLGLSSSKPGGLNWERGFHGLISPLLFPLFEEHRICVKLLNEKYDPMSVAKLRDKLNHLIKAHGQWPPASLTYLCLDPQYIFKNKSFYYFTSHKTLKESLYGSKS